jgi:hypothetical protein
MKENEKEIAELKVLLLGEIYKFTQFFHMINFQAKTEQELMAFGAQLKEAEENAQRQIKEVKVKSNPE